MLKACVFGLCAAGGVASGSVFFGRVDTFDTGVMGWGNTSGHDTTSWVSGGGPGGAGDAYMQMESSGQPSGSGSRLGGWTEDWGGDYIGQGITSIQVDMAGFEGTGAEMRLLLLSDTGSFFTTTASHSVPTDGVWRTYTFDISETGMTQVNGLLGYQDSFGVIWRVHLRHQPGAPAGLSGAPAYDGRIGVDNIRAVPAAPGLAAIGLGLAGLGGRRKR